nr:hypothetical protein [Tanacetum cinerariifolium]GEW28473.1 hypothetical protein [Tanacetum cinerariifolium]
MPKPSSTKWNKVTCDIYDQKDKLYRMMEKVKAFNKHLAHKALFDALALSLSVDEDDMDMLPDQPTQKKRIRDDHDKEPSPDADKDSKKKKRKDPKAPSSKKTKDQPSSSKGTTLSKSSKMIKQEESDDLLGTTFDFSNFVKQRLKKNKLTKPDIEVFELLKGTCKSCIELEHHLEQRYLAFSDKLDWTNPKGDRIPQDLSKLIPLLGAPHRLYILADYFFNKDLEYLRSGNLEERKYTASFTKAKATSIVKISMEKEYGYGYLKEIVVKRANQKEYKFKEDMFLLYYQNKLQHLDGNIQSDLVVALRLYKLISQLKIHGETISQEGLNLKLLRGLLSELKTHTLIWKNKPDFKALTMDDLYNKRKIYKTKVKGSSSSSENSQNVAFVSSNSSGNTNQAYSSNSENTNNLSDVVIYSLYANQSNNLQLDNEELQQINANDFEEMDLKWQMAMLTIRAKKFLKKTGRKAEDGPTNFALMAYTSSGSSSSSSSDTEELHAPKHNLILADVDEYVVIESVTSVPTVAINKAKTRLHEKAMAAFESHYIDRDTYPASAEDVEVHSCFFDDQLTSLSPPRSYIPPDVLLHESR